MRDPYAVLGLERDADDASIKKAYRAAALRWHPDRNPDPEAEARFKEAAEAFAVLKDPSQRRSLDAATASTAGLADDFLDHVASALDRAEDWMQRSVLPHYLRYRRGQGLEMRARLLRDLEDLVPGVFSPQQDGALLQRWRRWQARRLSRRLQIHVYDWPLGSLSHLRRFPWGFEILITPWVLWQQGFRDTTEIDDALLRVVVARSIQVYAAGLWVPYDVDWDAFIAEARQADTLAMRWALAGRAMWVGVGVVMLWMLYAGWPR